MVTACAAGPAGSRDAAAIAVVVSAVMRFIGVSPCGVSRWCGGSFANFVLGGCEFTALFIVVDWCYLGDIWGGVAAVCLVLVGLFLVFSG